MSTQPTSTFVTVEEYLAAEREVETKSEYIDGVVRAMSGASINHVRIVANLIRELGNQLLARECDVLPVDMKVRMPDSRKFYYPDVAVLCGEPQFHDEHTDNILNPVVLIEVLSKSTESIDRGEKFQAYLQLESLKEYLLVAQDKAVVEQYVKQPDGTWNYKVVIGRESSLRLPSVGCTLELSMVYNRVAWE